MGNEGSALPGLEIDSTALENTDEWTLHAATSTCSATPNLSVFCGRQAHDNLNNNPLQQAVQNLRIYRHPNILKFVSSWTHQGQLHMATESVHPLTRVIGNQTVLEICLGLHDILKALIFLHEKAQCSHNNVCCAAIYVTSDGSWKLGGLEYLSKFSLVTHEYLQKMRARRYEKGVPPEEDSCKTVDPQAIDAFAFGVLVEDVFNKIPDDMQVPGFKEFREMCLKQLKNPEPLSRPKLSQLLNQPIFNHRFVVIHDFLSELPLKSDGEKAIFFRGLVDQLREFPEVLLGSQLSVLLLSRLVLLDKTAQKHLLPMIFQPQNADFKSGANSPLFSLDTFQQYIIPRLLHMFSVRDAQIRLLLLKHFEHYCAAFSKDQLCSKVLPELLVGIKDTNDTVVASTLRALAQLVPILGATTVIGGRRARLFTDGRPKQDGIPAKQSPSKLFGQSGCSKERVKSSTAQEISSPISIAEELPERPSPDGGEDLSLPTPMDEETDNWSDWDLNESQVSNSHENSTGTSEQLPYAPAESLPDPFVLTQSSETIVASRACLPDITSLDIKNSIAFCKKQNVPVEIDFFQDMEPVISKPKLLHFDDLTSTQELESNKATSCFDVDLSACPVPDGEGWGDNDDWGDVSDADITNS